MRICLPTVLILLGLLLRPCLATGLLAHTPVYNATLVGQRLELTSTEGLPLCSFPLGCQAAPADSELVVWPTPARPVGLPVRKIVSGVVQWQWRWRFEAAWPVEEQLETLTCYPNRVVYQASLKWRGRSPRLARLVYGASLAPGCVDLEGLWNLREGDGPELPAPVPGVFEAKGLFEYHKLVALPSSSALWLLLGGVDDLDETFLDGKLVGATALDSSVASWAKVRRYRLPPQSSPSELLVRVRNEAGRGGLWRAPCVIGPQNALNSTDSRDGWTWARGKGSTLYDWCPDEWQRSTEGRFVVSLTSRDRTVNIVPDNITTGGRFQLPPYLVAIQAGQACWGLGTLDLPRSEDGLRVEWNQGAFRCPFLLATEHPGEPGTWTRGPRLGLFVAPSKQVILEDYLTALPHQEASPRPAWWSGPEYCTWGDQSYVARDRSESDVGSLTEARYRSWFEALESWGFDFPLVTLDAGWWQLPQGLVDELHAQDRHTLLWTQPHWAPKGGELLDHPEWMAHDEHGQPWEFDTGNWLFDYTQLGTRDYIERQLHSYLGADDWDTDGIKLDFAYTAPPLWARLADPDWGAGEQYRARVLAWWYHTVKRLKPDALLTGSSMNPLFGRVQDYCRLNEDWTANPETYRKRAEAVLAFGQWAWCDDWLCYEDYLTSQLVERPIWGSLNLSSALYREDSQGNLLPLSPAWQGRLAAVSKLATLAPVQEDQHAEYNAASGLARRLDASGRLVAGAFALDEKPGENLVLVVAQPGRWFIAAIETGSLTLQVPERVAGVEAVLDSGEHLLATWSQSTKTLKLRVEDSAGPVDHYEVILEGCS